MTPSSCGSSRGQDRDRVNENQGDDDDTEPILRRSREQYSLFPIKYPDLWQYYKRCLCSFWTCEEVDLGKDRKDWFELKSCEQDLILNVLAFFAVSDTIVGENLLVRFSSEVQIPEARAFYAFQASTESIHSEMYNLLLQTYVDDSGTRNSLFRSIQTMPHVRKKAEWCINWIHSNESFAQRLIAFAAVEGIFFSGSFATIFWLKKRGKLPGLTFSNELIARDEGTHVTFACMLYGHLNVRLSESKVLEIVQSAVEVEMKFWEFALNTNILGFTLEQMQDYVKFIADDLLVSLGNQKHWSVQNPFDFMENISLEGKSNFFERRVSEYRRLNIGIGDWKGAEFRTDVEF